MKLVHNWKDIFRHAWSFKWMLIALVFTVAEYVLPLFEAELSRVVFATLSAVSIIAGLVSRLLLQKELE